MWKPAGKLTIRLNRRPGCSSETRTSPPGIFTLASDKAKEFDATLRIATVELIPAASDPIGSVIWLGVIWIGSCTLRKALMLSVGIFAEEVFIVMGTVT